MKLARVLRVMAIPLLLGLISTPATGAEPEKSDNVKLLKRFEYPGTTGDFFQGGTDIDFSGKYVYAAQQGLAGGIHIYDASKKVPKEVGFVKCPGEQNDVAVVKPGLIAIGYHSSSCGIPGKGVRLVNVKNPKKPKLLGQVELPGGTHTLTVYPGKPIIYASPGGLAVNGGGTQQILDVSNPKKPVVAAELDTNPNGCHDVTFDIRKGRKIAFCPGLTEVQIWDVSDPLAPEGIGHIVNPLTFFPHSAAVSPDGDFVVIGDENFAADECVGGPTGALMIYDLANLAAPTPIGYFGINRGPEPVSSPDVDRAAWCTAHLFNFIPGTRTLVASWYAAGMNVIDLSDPSSPTEIEYYGGDDVNYWSAYWYDGRIWANDRVRGLDVFTVKGLKEGKKK